MYHEQFNLALVICLHTVKCQTVLFQAIQFSISHLFALSSSVKKVLERTISGATIQARVDLGR